MELLGFQMIRKQFTFNLAGGCERGLLCEIEPWMFWHVDIGMLCWCVMYMFTPWSFSNQYLSVHHSALSLFLSQLRHTWLENEAFLDVRSRISSNIYEHLVYRNLVNTRDFWLFTACLWFRTPKVRSSTKPCAEGCQGIIVEHGGNENPFRSMHSIHI